MEIKDAGSDLRDIVWRYLDQRPYMDEGERRVLLEAIRVLASMPVTINKGKG